MVSESHANAVVYTMPEVYRSHHRNVVAKSCQNYTDVEYLMARKEYVKATWPDTFWESFSAMAGQSRSITEQVNFNSLNESTTYVKCCRGKNPIHPDISQATIPFYYQGVCDGKGTAET
jgi:hypothetical protein